MKEIMTTDGTLFLVSNEDFNLINDKYTCKIYKDGYVYCTPIDKSLKLPYDNLHRILMNPSREKGVHIDHINGDKLDNRRENLRICSHQENMRNKKPHRMYKNKPTTSKYKGVVWDKVRKLWIVKITDGEKYSNKGGYTNEIAAANCYNYYAEKMFGEFSQLNDCPLMDVEEWESYISRRKTTSAYRGVSFFNGKWLAQVWDNNSKRNVNMGTYDCENEAAIAYNKGAIELKGEKAKLNIIK
ncbi:MULTISPECIES: HNH endonuclease [Lysinibacillus]|uniref:HNH endonuclease n=1 Tax=Lysinibacillus TaxID=400634 RepID=UPI00214ACBCB|nr:MULTISPECIES: HNH endonuclease [Lysinibacillus]UUV25924.1 HNH endonuclease [Lysinibacillus sp. FN11]UYB48797.1 HNH endonuclease [Lysinibacillus capsici]